MLFIMHCRIVPARVLICLGVFVFHNNNNKQNYKCRWHHLIIYNSKFVSKIADEIKCSNKNV